jgi:AI-2 transport protein TqsA
MHNQAKRFGRDEITEGLSDSLVRLLLVAACLVIVAWGIKQASHIIVLLLLALLLAYCVIPLPKWMMRRFNLSKSLAVVLTVTVVGVFYLVASALLVESALRMKERLPVYEEHLKIIYEHIQVFLANRGYQVPAISTSDIFSSERIIAFARMGVPKAMGFVSDRFLIALMSLLFVFEMAEEEGKQKRLVAGLSYYGGDVQRFIAISAKTGAITALANLVLLVALGVDFPVIWCFLYFFLHFIPNVGFIIALIPPSLLALLTMGWKRALLVAGGLVLTNMVADYVINPIFMKKEVHISFLEIMLSLIIWGALLGPPGGIVAIPLTLALRKFGERFSTNSEATLEPSG